MKVVLSFPDNKVNFMLELLQNFTFVKAKVIDPTASEEKALFLAEFGDSINELNEVLSGKAQARDAYELLDEL